MIKKVTCLLFVLSVLSVTSQAQHKWDWHIAGGKVIDGSGAEAFKADVLIAADTIAFIGTVDKGTVEARNTVDATGKVVSPGFIDAHAHGNPLETPRFKNFLAMGVTTILLGQDGSSPTSESLEDWFRKADKAGPALNIAALIGHATLRQKSGAGKGPANQQELNKMTRYLQQDMKGGAFGMSSGIEYVPGLYADENELVALAKETGKHDGIIMSHMRSEDDSRIEESLEELAVQGAFAKVHASHLKVVYGKGKERAGDILNQIENYRNQGLSYSADTYPYAASYTGIGIVFPEWAKTEADWKQAVKERPAVLREFLANKITQRNGPDAILFGSGAFAGITLKQAAEREGIPAVELLMQMGPNAASAAHFVMNEALQDSIAAAPGVMISSDGSPTMYHPRGYGSFAKVIRKYVHEQQVLSIEEAVYKMSGLPAQSIGIEKRGLLEQGYKADILIFDPAEVNDIATFTEPHKLAEGFNWIWVNGKLVREDGSFTNKSAGEILKKQIK